MIIQDENSAFKIENGTLLCAALTNDGRIEEDNWTEVDFYSIDEQDAAYCRAIEKAIQLYPVY